MSESTTCADGSTPSHLILTIYSGTANRRTMTSITMPIWFRELSVCAMGNIDISDIRFYRSILLQRMPYVLAIAATVFVSAVSVALLLSPVYRASAKILAESPQIPAELARSTVPIGAVAQLQILQQQITTRADLIALAQKLHVYDDSETQPDGDDIVKDMLARIAFEQLQLDPQGDGASIFSVSFQANEPDLAANGANELAAMILGRNQRQRTDRAGSTLQFFNREVSRLGSELSRLEADILKFKTEHKDTLPDSLEFHRSQQSSLQERLIALQREESDLRTRRSSLVATYATSGQLVGAASLTPEQQMLAELNRALSEQLLIFSEASPNISALRLRIASLQNSLLAIKPEGTKKAGAAATQGTPFGLNLQLSDVDKRLQAVAAEKVSVARRIEELTQAISGTPASETALNSLERNRENIQTQYNAAIARRAEALTGEQIEMRSDGERFSVLEAATPPSQPIRPQRKRLVGLTSVAGIGLGLAFVVLLEVFNKTVRRPVELERLLQSPPLATIPNISSPGELPPSRLRRRIAALIAAGVIPISFIVADPVWMQSPSTDRETVAEQIAQHELYLSSGSELKT